MTSGPRSDDRGGRPWRRRLGPHWRVLRIGVGVPGENYRHGGWRPGRLLRARSHPHAARTKRTHPRKSPADQWSSTRARPSIAKLAVTGPKDLDEWSLAGLTREQGLARWSRVFAGRSSTSRLTVSTSWGWLAWEPADSEAAYVARMAGRTPPPVLVEIAVRDPDSRARRLSPQTAADPITTGAWGALTGMIAGGVAGVWLWGLQGAALAVAGAAGTAAVAALRRRLTAPTRRHVRVLTERDSTVASVFAGAKVLAWVTDHLRIHESAIAGKQHSKSGIPAHHEPQFPEAVYQLHRALWALATGQADDAGGTLSEMTNYANLVLQLIDARERVRRASTVRVPRPAPPPRAKDPAVNRLRDAARRLEDTIQCQRHAASVIGDINRRFDEAG